MLRPVHTYPFLSASLSHCQHATLSLSLSLSHSASPSSQYPSSALTHPSLPFPRAGGTLLLLSLDLRCWHSVLSRRPVCATGRLCVSKRVPTPAPGATKELFFAHQWLPLTLGPLLLEGMSGFPRWHIETAIRGRKQGVGAPWESCQGKGGWQGSK